MSPRASSEGSRAFFIGDGNVETRRPVNYDPRRSPSYLPCGTKVNLISRYVNHQGESTDLCYVELPNRSHKVVPYCDLLAVPPRKDHTEWQLDTTALMKYHSPVLGRIRCCSSKMWHQLQDYQCCVKAGVLQLRTELPSLSIRLETILDAQITQSWWQRQCDVYEIRLKTQSGRAVRICGLPHPEEFCESLLQRRQGGGDLPSPKASAAENKPLGTANPQEPASPQARKTSFTDKIANLANCVIPRRPSRGPEPS